MLSRLVYFSDRRCDAGDLARLSAAAAIKNRASDVASLLVADDVGFIQALEGPRPALSALVSDLVRDPRHERLQIVEAAEIVQRSFPAWPLALVEDVPTIEAAWRRMGRPRSQPYGLSALQIRGFLRIAMTAASPIGHTLQPLARAS